MLWLLACAAPSTDTAERDLTADDAWGSLIAPEDASAPWDAATVEDIVARALRFGVPHPLDQLNAYLPLLAHGDASCPGAEFAEGFVQLSGCTTDDGYTFRGAAGVARADDRVTQSDGRRVGTWSMQFQPADFVVLRPDGSGLRAGGAPMLLVQTDARGRRWSSTVGGTWRDEADAGWLGAGYSGMLITQGLDEGVARQVFEGPMGVGDAHLMFSQLRVEADCAGAAGGTLSVRRADGAWASVSWTGCAPCGAAVDDDGVAFGDACPDLSALQNVAARMVAP